MEEVYSTVFLLSPLPAAGPRGDETRPGGSLFRPRVPPPCLSFPGASRCPPGRHCLDPPSCPRFCDPRRDLQSLYRLLPTGACQDASMMLCEPPTVPQVLSLSPDCIKTRTDEPVPPAVITRTL